MKNCIIFAVIFGIISAAITFLLETVLNVHVPTLDVAINVLFITLGCSLGIWKDKKDKNKEE